MTFSDIRPSYSGENFRVYGIKKMCYTSPITNITYLGSIESALLWRDRMVVKIDFNSDEAIYIQLRNQIVIGIATAEIREGDSLPSVRDLAENIGINMHTVNKAYSILKQEGYLKLDRRKGAVIAVDTDKYEAKLAMMDDLRMILAEGICKEISCQEVHHMIDEIYREFRGEV